MNEDDKRKFDSLHAISEQSWRDWDHKTRGEWRLSFGVWVALLAAIATVGKTEVEVPWIAVGLVALAIVLVHLNFSRWVQTMLTICRTNMQRSQAAMYQLAALQRVPQVRKPWSKQVSMWTQASITVLLALCLILVSIQPTQDSHQALDRRCVACAPCLSEDEG